MNRNITNLTRFICCIMIFMHHFFLGHPIVHGFGHLGCTIFFFLSSYGINKSLTKNPISFLVFIQKKATKIWIPLIIINLLSIIVTNVFFTNKFSYPIYDVFCEKISYAPIDSFMKLVGLLVGYPKIDSVTWFLDILLLSYLGLWYIQSKNIPLKYIVYCFILWFIVGFSIVKSYYIIDIQGILAGLLYARYEQHINIQLQKKHIIIVSTLIFIVFFIFDIVYSNTLEGRYNKIISLIYSLSILPLVTTISKHNLKLRIATFLGGISYFIYLLHVKVSCIINNIYGTNNLGISILFTFIVSCVLYYINHIISRSINKKQWVSYR